jgi:hypothetical protein
MQADSNQLLNRTRAAFIWTRIAGTPFWVLLSLLTFILYKDLHISPLQITLLVVLKPMSSLLAPYWSQAIYQRPDHIVGNLVWANVLRYVPFLFLPWVDSPWLLISAFALYMLLHRGSMPAWMEIFKHNLPKETRERLITYGTTIDYCGNAVLSIFLGLIMDQFEHAWRWLFPLTAVFGLISTYFLLRIPSPVIDEPKIIKSEVQFNFKEHVLKPWKQSWNLIRERTDFAMYQVGFMLGGAGLMIVQPALPVFFVDTLSLSYTEMSLALAMCKGIGVLIASRFWTRLFRKLDIYYFSGLVTILAALSSLLLLMAPMHLFLLYAAYILYGVMQSGSELSWHMSGLVFAKEKESSAFSGTNILTVGMRGCIIPAMGALLLPAAHSVGVMLIGASLSLIATWHLMRYSSKQHEVGSIPS